MRAASAKAPISDDSRATSHITSSNAAPLLLRGRVTG